VTKKNTSGKKSPNHVAIIMDGNGRWAKERGLPRRKGHEEGVKNARRVVSIAQKFGVKYLTLYTFSTENWQRPKQEVGALLRILYQFLKEYANELVEKEVRVHVIGKYKEMPKVIALAFEKLIKDTAHFDDLHLILAVNYSSRSEIVETIKRMMQSKEDGIWDELDWEELSNHLDTRGIPDPDLIIRTSGENRLSNFLLLQGAYSEIYFSSVYWPDFGEGHFYEALEHYERKERRFGKTSDQLLTESIKNYDKTHS